MTDISAIKAPSGNVEQLGPRLRKLRLEKGLSMNELANRSEVSVGMISQIERGLANPSMRILERLRVSLNVPLTTLLEDREQGASVGTPALNFVRRAAHRPHFTVTAGGLAKELLSPHGDHNLQFMMITIPAGSRSHEILLGTGEKAGLVMEGHIVLTVGTKSEQLTPGDSFQFDSAIPHGVSNPTSTDARILWIMNVQLRVMHL